MKHRCLLALAPLLLMLAATGHAERRYCLTGRKLRD